MQRWIFKHIFFRSHIDLPHTYHSCYEYSTTDIKVYVALNWGREVRSCVCIHFAHIDACFMIIEFTENCFALHKFDFIVNNVNSPLCYKVKNKGNWKVVSMFACKFNLKIEFCLVFLVEAKDEQLRCRYFSLIYLFSYWDMQMFMI